MKGKLILGVMVLVFALAVVPLACSNTEEGGTPGEPGVGYVGPADGPGFDVSLDGELNITLANLSLYPVEVYLKRGEEANIPILIHFNSCKPEVTELPLMIDPTNWRCGVHMEFPYIIFDDKGNEIGRGSIWDEEIISYNVTGTVVIKSGETLPLMVTVRVPEDLPERISKSSFPMILSGICFAYEEYNLGGMDWVKNIKVHIID